MAVNLRKFLQGIGLIPKTTSSIDAAGELEVLSSDNKIRYHNGSSISPIVTADHAETLVSKTIDADANTISNIENADIKTGAAIDATKIHDGSVSNTEFGYISTLTSNAQDQLDAKASSTDLSNHINDASDAHDASAISNVPAGSIAATDVQAAIDELDGDIQGHITDAVDAHDASAISNIPSGNLAATEVQAALNELQSDIDTRATSSALTTHTGASSGVHGVTGDVVGTSDAQTLSNKTLSSPTINTPTVDVLNWDDQTTPANPSAGFYKTYFKNDGKLYKLNSAGVEAEVGGGTNSPLTTKGDLYTYSTANDRLPVGTNGQHLSADSTQSTGLKWVTSGRTINTQTGTTYTFALSDGSAVDGNPLVTADNASAQTYTVPPNSSVAFPVGTQIDVLQLGAGLVTLAAGSGVTLNSLNGGLTLLGQNAAATLVKVATDTWEVLGTGVNSTLLSLSDWVAYTPTFTGFGTVSTQSFWWRRVGDSVEIEGKFTIGTATSTEARISLPNSITSDATKVPAIRSTGKYFRAGSYSSHGGPILIESNVGYVTFGNKDTFGSGTVDSTAKVNGDSLNNGDVIHVSGVKIPISGWTSTSSGTLTAPRSEVAVSGGNGFGSTATQIRRFDTIEKNIGPAITYADSGTNGGTFTINEPGVYAVSYSDFDVGGGDTFGISVNTSATTTTIGSVTYSQGKRAQCRIDTTGGGSNGCSWTGNLSVGDIVRAHGGSGLDATNAIDTIFTIVKVSN